MAMASKGQILSLFKSMNQALGSLGTSGGMLLCRIVLDVVKEMQTGNLR